MSVNIQLENGLKKLSGQTMTKEKIIENLGYTPADEAAVDRYIDNLESDIKDLENDINDVEAVFNNYLKEKPDIVEDKSGEAIFVDEQNNIIAKIDSEGIHTTAVEAESFNTNSDNLTISDNDGNNIFKVDAQGVHTTSLKLNSGDVDQQFQDVKDNHTVHIIDKDIHITPVERNYWNNKSEFSGKFDDLLESPIVNDGSGKVTYADENGNIIFEVAADGARTTELNLKRIGDVADYVIGTSDELKVHDRNTVKHITDSERETWNNKVDATHVENAINNLVKNTFDNDFNFSTTVNNKINEKVDIADFDLHKADNVKHITAAERTKWNDKSDVKSYYDLPDAPNIRDDDSGEVVYVDEQGNIIAKINGAGFETTKVTANQILVNGVSVGEQLDNLSITKANKADLNSHTGDGNIHITPTERNDWNSKATPKYVDEKVAALVDSAPETLDTLNELAAALGDDPNFAATVAHEIGTKASQDSLDSHMANSVAHITASERNKWNNKSEFSGSYTDLSNAPNISENESGDLVITDKDGYIILRSDENGLETTNLIAKSVIVNNTDVEDTFDQLFADVRSKPGKKVAGQTFTIDGVETVAGVGAEIFNDYQNNIATGQSSHAEGVNTTAAAICSHAEGGGTKAMGAFAHAEGGYTEAAWYSHAEGGWTKATGFYTHAEGYNTTASGDTSHAEGNYTIATSKNQHVQGAFNIEDSSNTYAHIVGNGDSTARSNAHTLDWNGNAWFAGDVYVGSTSGTNKDTGSKKLVTIDELDSALINKSNNGHRHDNATASTDGFMSAADKSKLDGITGTGDYVLPEATSTELGGVKIGSNISVSNGTISLSKDNITNALGYTPPTENTTYTLESLGAAPASHTHTKSQISDFSHTHTKSQISDFPSSMPASDVYSWAKASSKPSYTYSEVGAAAASHTHTKSQITDFPTIPTVGNGTVTIKQNGTDKGSFTLNQSGNITIELSDTDTNTTYSNATQSTAGLMSANDKKKLDGLGGTGDYVLPTATSTTLGGVKVGSNITNDNGTISLSKSNVTNALGYTPPTTNTTYGVVSTSADGLAPKRDGSTSKFLRGDGTWAVPPDTNTTYSAATQSAAGLMSASDKQKLDGIASGANNYTYTLPSATSSTLGGVKIGSNITVSSGTISLSKSNVTSALGYTPPTTNTTYGEATTSAAGLMSAADKTKLNGIATGANNYTYTLPNATSSTLGGVKIGSNITVSSGTISLSKSNVTSALGYTPPTTNTTYGEATTSAAGLMSASDKSKLNGIASGANAYSHPTGNGNNHIPSGGSSGQILRWSSAGTAVWGSDNNTTYSNATTSAAGLMSAADKKSMIYSQINHVSTNSSSSWTEFAVSGGNVVAVLILVKGSVNDWNIPVVYPSAYGEYNYIAHFNNYGNLNSSIEQWPINVQVIKGSSGDTVRIQRYDGYSALLYCYCTTLYTLK